MNEPTTEPTIEEQRISQHADTLNALAEMQHSIAYAARRSVLADAERIIAELEHENKRLHANFGLLQAEANLAQAREVKWRKGGARGAEVSNIVRSTLGYLVAYEHRTGERVRYSDKFYGHDKGDEYFSSTHATYIPWPQVTHYLPLSDLPLPSDQTGEVQGE